MKVQVLYHSGDEMSFVGVFPSSASDEDLFKAIEKDLEEWAYAPKDSGWEYKLVREGDIIRVVYTDDAETWDHTWSDDSDGSYILEETEFHKTIGSGEYYVKKNC